MRHLIPLLRTVALGLLLLMGLAGSVGAQGKPFITKWRTVTAGEELRIPFIGKNFKVAYYVPGGEKTVVTVEESSTRKPFVVKSPTAGEFLIEAGPEGLTKLRLGTDGQVSTGSGVKNLVGVTQWGDVEWEDLHSAFSGCENLEELPANEGPKLGRGVVLDYTFYGCTKLNQPVQHWDVSKVGSIRYTFTNCTAFNQPLEEWNVENVQHMDHILDGCSSFNQSLGKWNLQRVNQVGLQGTAISRRNYDESIKGWASHDIREGRVLIVAPKLVYTCESLERDRLIGRGWIFEGDVQACFTLSGPFKLAVGGAETIKAIFDGPVPAEERIIQWSTTTPELISIDDKGLVTALKPGMAKVTAIWEGRERTHQIQITPTVTSVEVHPAEITMKVGQRDYKIFAVVLPANAEGRELAWTVEPSELATTDGHNISALKAGVGKVIATARNGVKGEAVLTVLETTEEIKPVVGIEVYPPVIEMQLGDKPVQVRAKVIPDDATNKTLKWRVEPADGAIVDNNGLVTVLKAGGYQVFAEAHNGVQGVCNVHVAPAGSHHGITSVKVMPARLAIDKGTTPVKLTTLIEPASMANNTLRWIADPADVVYVTNEGTVIGMKAGRARVTATALSGVSGECEVIVNESTTPQVSLTIFPANLNMRKDGAPVQMHAEILPADLGDKTIAWFVESGTSATVSATGLVTPTGKEIGETVIRAMGYNGATAKCTVRVVDEADMAKPVTSVAITPRTLQMKVGDTPATLEIAVTPSDATDKSVNYATEPSGIVKVEDGKVTPLKAGQAKVYAIAHNGVMGVCDMNVVDLSAPVVPVSEVKVMPEKLQMKMGDAPAQLTAQVLPAEASDRNLTWTIEPADLAKVEGGLVTPLKAGQGMIVATSKNGKNGGCMLIVEEANAPTVAVKSVTVEPEDVMLPMGAQPVTLTAKVQPEDATVQTVTWSIEPEGIATVTEAGVVTPVKSGTAWVIATANNGVQGKSRVNVLQNKDPEFEVQTVTVIPATLNIKMGENPVQLTAQVMPEKAANKEITWNADPNDVVKLENGLITPQKVGVAVVTASTANGKKGTCIVNVLDATAPVVSVTSVTIAPESVEMHMGDAPMQLNATVMPEEATNKILTWTAEPKGIVSVDLSGRIVPLAVGTTKVIAMAHNGVQGTCEVKVAEALPPVAVESVTLLPAKLTMKVGEAPATLTAKVLPATATDKTLVWSVENATIASVTDGMVTPLAAGTTKVFAMATNGVRGECEVTVEDASSPTISVTSVGIVPSTLMMQVGDKPRQLEVNVLPADATNKEVTWSVEPEGIVTLENGLVTPVKEGKATVTATSHNGKQGTCVITVTAAPVPPTVEVASVAVDPATVKMFVGDSPVQLAATVSPVDATDKTITWSVSPEGIVTVDNQGKVTAVKVGEATVTATAHNGVKGTCTVTVEEKNPNTTPTAVEALLSVVVSPNPFDAQFTVQRASEVVRYELVNAMGQVVLAGQGTGETLTVGTAHLPRGVYVLRLHAKNGSHSITLVK